MKKKQIDATATFEIAFYEKLLTEDPCFVDALIPLAHLYTLAGEHEKALILDKKLSFLRPHDETVFYNLACSYALLNMKKEACESLEKAIMLGYDDRGHLERDHDLDSIRGHEAFQTLIQKLQERKEY